MEDPTIEELNQIELRTEEVQEILGTPPHWLVRWGIMVILTTVLGLIGVSWWVEYPDIISAPITITTQQPPVKVVAPLAGNINALLVKDNEMVEANQRLAILKSVANPKAIFDLEQQLRTISNLEPDSLLLLDFALHQNLGELQADYADFVRNLDDYQLFLSQQTALKKIPFLQQEIGNYNKLNAALLSKDSVLQQEIAVAQQQYDRQKEVLDMGGTTIVEVQKQETTLLQYQRERKNTQLNLLNNDIVINQLESQISAIRLQTQEAGQSKFIRIKESFKRLQSQLDTWLQRYVLIAPIGGKVSFHNYWSEQQFVAANTPVMTIVPETANIMGKVLLPIQGSGKVEENQLVNIKLSSFPFREYGMLKGQVKKIALAPYDNNYAVEIELLHGLTTTYNKDLLFRQQMQGTAEIITKERRLLERILESLIFK